MKANSLLTAVELKENSENRDLDIKCLNICKLFGQGWYHQMMMVKLRVGGMEKSRWGTPYIPIQQQHPEQLPSWESYSGDAKPFTQKLTRIFKTFFLHNHFCWESVTRLGEHSSSQILPVERESLSHIQSILIHLEDSGKHSLASIVSPLGIHGVWHTVVHLGAVTNKHTVI